MRLVAVRAILVCGLLLLWPAAESRACSCEGDSTTAKEALTRYDAVFVGQILAMKVRSSGGVVISSDPEPVDGFEVVAKVLEAWKGTTESRVVLFTGPTGGMCGYPFQVGESYLVWARRSEEGLASQLCDRTKSVDAAAAVTDLEYLRRQAEVSTWRIVTGAGFTLRLPDGFAPDKTRLDVEGLPGGLRTWGIPLKPPRAGGWSRGEETVLYEVVGYDAVAGKPRCESEVAGHRATIVHQGFEDGRAVISVHWPDVLRERGDAQGASPGGLTIHCLSGRGPASNRSNICDSVFESVQFIGEPR